MYDYNPQEAMKSESNRLTETGKYKGTFTLAYEMTPNANGTKGVSLDFKAEDGRVLEGIRLYTENGSGAKIQGYNMLMALMGCMRTRSVKPEQKTVELWNKDEGKKVPTEVTILPELMNKPIGLVLQRTEYWSDKHNEVRSNLVIVMPFTHDTEMSITELQSGATTAKTLANRLSTLNDKLLPRKKLPEASSSTPDFDDDIPF